MNEIIENFAKKFMPRGNSTADSIARAYNGKLNKQQWKHVYRACRKAHRIAAEQAAETILYGTSVKWVCSDEVFGVSEKHISQEQFLDD